MGYISAVDFPTWKESSFSFFFLFFFFKARASDQENHNRRSSCDNSLEDTKKSPQAENNLQFFTKFRNKDSKMKVTMVCSVVALFLAVWTQAAPVENGEIDFDSAKGVQRMARGRCCTQ